MSFSIAIFYPEYTGRLQTSGVHSTLMCSFLGGSGPTRASFCGESARRAGPAWNREVPWPIMAITNDQSRRSEAALPTHLCALLTNRRFGGS